MRNDDGTLITLTKGVQWTYAPGRVRLYLKGTSVEFMNADMTERRQALQAQQLDEFVRAGGGSTHE